MSFIALPSVRRWLREREFDGSLRSLEASGKPEADAPAGAFSTDEAE